MTHERPYFYFSEKDEHYTGKCIFDENICSTSINHHPSLTYYISSNVIN